MVCLADLAKSNNTYEFEHEGNPYSIKFSNTEIVFIEFGFSIDRETPFKHGRENSKVLIARPTIHEFKHCPSNRPKFWTRAAGYSLSFSVPASEIFVLPYAGYSYPKIIIAGVEMSLSCGGGTSGNGWRDYVSSCTHVGVNAKIAKLNAVISKASEAKDVADTLKLRMRALKLSEYDNEYWKEQFTRQHTELKSGMKIVLCKGFNVRGCKEAVLTGKPFSKGKNWYAEFVGIGITYITVNQIDYVKTALANGLTVVDPSNFIFTRVPVADDPNFNGFADTFKELIGVE